jgi:hypothetical protein
MVFELYPAELSNWELTFVDLLQSLQAKPRIVISITHPSHLTTIILLSVILCFYTVQSKKFMNFLSVFSET